MSELHLAIAHAVKLALVALLAGLLWRRRARLCWSFAAYALAILVGNSLASFWPAQFYTPSFWVLKQGVYDALKMAIALELAGRAFIAFPGAMRVARRVFLAVLALSTFVLTALTPPSSYLTLWEWQPGIATAALWLLTATALLVVWYQVPVHEWQRAIMLGFAPYLLVFVTVLDLLRRHGWAALHAGTGLLDSAAYLALVTFWAWAAWRRDPALEAPAPAASPA
jgi:hypothetical protein